MSSIEEKLRRYEKIDFLGEGQFATVYKARDKENDGRIVAVKKIKLGSRAEAKDGINRTALREIKLLQEVHHKNIIELVDVFGHKSNVSIVMDFMDTDLEVIIKDTNIILSAANIKSYILQTLQGLEYLHANWILHRDLKPNNLLVDCKGCLKLGDFGLAKYFGSPNRQYTHVVVTRWYRAPELLFGAKNYGTGVDIWAVGCILAELLLRIPFLAGETDLDQLAKIFQALGTPTEESWPGLKALPDFIQFKHHPGTPLQDIFTAAGDDLLQLMGQLLALCPLKRCDSSAALRTPYFSNKPAPSSGESLPLPSTIAKREQERPNKRKMIDTEFNPTIKKLVFT
ncbi:cyclin-dependent kinase 7-like [Eurytemora carolleeae]|uniref:cyclin-dependent kinase 7-like n=1 Tax=Eurytemora carolleeae TaxID=1294199 RepID=UPI000C75AE71|nr:cyclin-dependent kinase 7-like [Eurytemora carolleeae]|eukprot:XP_023340935.1 cyclin-dependent kinase 7-like [Eurytemora affinis]